MTEAAIEAFWKYWATAKDRIAASFSDKGMRQEDIDAMNEKVAQIDPSLDWEFGPGKKSQHHLCLSSKGDPVLRVVAERWLRRAPAADATWEYYAARQAHPTGGLRLDIAGHAIALDELVVAVEEDKDRERLDVELYHPVFRQIDDEELRARIVFIGLDTLLGEDGVERWIGGVDVAKKKPKGGIPLPELPARLREFEKKTTGDSWAVLQGEREGKPIFVSKNMAVKRIDHLLLDTHVAVDITLENPTDVGLTTKDEADELNTMEDALFEPLGKEVVYIARETWGGHRVMHMHVMEGGPAAGIIDRWRRRYAARKIEVQVSPDPRWDILDRWG
jgi:hypothetical protein